MPSGAIGASDEFQMLLLTRLQRSFLRQLNGSNYNLQAELHILY